MTHFNFALPWNASNAAAGLRALQGWTGGGMPAEMNAQTPNLEGMYYGIQEEAVEVLEPLIKDIGRVLQDVTETDSSAWAARPFRPRPLSRLDAPLQQG